MTNLEYDQMLNKRCEEIKILIAKVFVTPSADELRKLSSFSKLTTLTTREKLTLSNYINFLKNKYGISINMLGKESIIKEEDYEYVKGYIDEALTITYLNSLSHKMLMQDGEFGELLTVIFNKIKADEYDRYFAAFTNRTLLKIIYNKRLNHKSLERFIERLMMVFNEGATFEELVNYASSFGVNKGGMKV